MMSIPSQNPPLIDHFLGAGKHLHSTIGRSQEGVLVDSKNKGEGREMLSVAIRIQAKHETHHVKVSKVFF